MKRLWLLLLPVGAGLALWAGMSAFPSLIVVSLILLPLSLGFAVQGNVLALTRQRFKWLRLVSLAPLLIPIAGTAYEASLQGMFWQLAAVIWVASAVLYLAGWAAAWPLEGKAHG